MINDAGLNILKSFEHCRLTAYPDSTGIWTIGWGRTSNVNEGDTCTQEQADQWLLDDLKYHEGIVDSAVTADINENQRAALVVFCYNVGHGKKGVKDGLVELVNGGQSHLLIYTNQSNFDAAADEFAKWAKAGGVTLNGLVRRRAAERALYIS